MVKSGTDMIGALLQDPLSFPKVADSQSDCKRGRTDVLRGNRTGSSPLIKRPRFLMEGEKDQRSCWDSMELRQVKEP